MIRIKKGGCEEMLKANGLDEMISVVVEGGYHHCVKQATSKERLEKYRNLLLFLERNEYFYRKDIVSGAIIVPYQKYKRAKNV